MAAGARATPAARTGPWALALNNRVAIVDLAR